MFAAVMLVFAQASGTPAPAAAPGGWANARPSECGALDAGRASNIWERAKAPELRRYCDLLASGASKLAGSASMAREVLTIADEADRAVPGQAGPSVLRGRALARLGRPAEALTALREAKAKDERVLDDPSSLLAWARVLARTGNPEEGSAAYRALLPRASTLSFADRGAALLEAGLLALARGPSGVDEATAIFRQARRESQDVLQSLAVMTLALALDRAGEKDEARAVLAERVHGDPRATLGEVRAKEIFATVLAAPESRAIAGLVLEASDTAAAREEWKGYLDAIGQKGPWAEHARHHETSPAGKRSRPKPPPP